MSTFHHDLMAQLDAAQQTGALSYAEHCAIRETLRRANMAGDPIMSLNELRALVSPKLNRH